jgi:hypothetical protein
VCLIDCAGRSLRRRIELAQRLDRVSDEFEANRLSRAGGEEIDHSAANREFARLVCRILPRIAGLD